MANAKLTTLAALLAAASVGGGGVYLLNDDGETYERATLPPAPITDALLLTADKTCLDEIQAVGDDPSCALVVSWYPIGGELRHPETKVYAEDGAEVPPSLSKMRKINFEAREAWACGGAVMPARIQDCLDDLHAGAVEAAAQ